MTRVVSYALQMFNGLVGMNVGGSIRAPSGGEWGWNASLLRGRPSRGKTVPRDDPASGR